MPTANETRDSYPHVGRVEWIGIAAATRAPLRSVDTVQVDPQHGVAGEHHGKNRARQVTLIQAEHLPVIAALARRETVSPEELRRNIVVSGLNLQSLIERRFRIGDVVLEGTGDCPPCERMEANLGPGGLNAMCRHGGIAARVIAGGQIKVGEPVHALLADG